MYKISFGVSYDDPLRTIAKKIKDYNSIENLNNNLNLFDVELQKKIDLLNTEKNNLILSYQHVNRVDYEQIKKRIKNINAEIKLYRDKISSNKNMLINVYYGYHERV